MSPRVIGQVGSTECAMTIDSGAKVLPHTHFNVSISPEYSSYFTKSAHTILNKQEKSFNSWVSFWHLFFVHLKSGKKHNTLRE